jgi:C-terminal processing protease CtpA/Prc
MKALRTSIVATLLILLTTAFAALAHAGSCEGSLQECAEKMAAKLQETAWVGLELDWLEDDGQYKVIKVIEKSPASEAGIRSGDLLLAFQGVNITACNRPKLAEMSRKVKPGELVVFTVEREEKELDVAMTSRPLPADLLAKYVAEYMKELGETNVSEDR